MSRLKEFREYREKMNAKILEAGNLEINRFFALDSRCYGPGVLPSKTKELMGLTASMVLRCDDCIAYHVIRAVEEGCTDAEIREAMSVSLVVGGSIVIPHLRRAFELLEEVRGAAETGAGS